jgi:hypothetical protein
LVLDGPGTLDLTAATTIDKGVPEFARAARGGARLLLGRE